MGAEVAIGVDIGGTAIKAGLVDARGRVLRTGTAATRAAEGAMAPIEVVHDLVAALLGSAADPVAPPAPRVEAAAIGIGAPGAIHPVSGALVGATPHMPFWTGFPLREVIAERLGREVTVENDANCAAWAEHHAGAARGARVSMTVMLGTGVGCGIVIDGVLLRGAFGGAGEIGHLPLGRSRDGDPQAIPAGCACGVTDCVEPEMSGGGLARAAAGAGLEGADAAAVFAAAARGEPAALALVDRFGDRLGAAIAAGVQLVNPEVVVIGGGVSGAGEALLARVRSAVERYALPSHRASLRIVRAAFGEHAGMVGAALAALAASPRD